MRSPAANYIVSEMSINDLIRDWELIGPSASTAYSYQVIRSRTTPMLIQWVPSEELAEYIFGVEP